MRLLPGCLLATPRSPATPTPTATGPTPWPTTLIRPWCHSCRLTPTRACSISRRKPRRNCRCEPVSPELLSMETGPGRELRAFFVSGSRAGQAYTRMIMARAEKFGYSVRLDADNHNLGGLDEGGGGLAGLEAHFAGGAGGNDGGDALPADGDFHFRHEAADAHLLDASHQLIAAADAAQDFLAHGFVVAAGAIQQAVHLRPRNAVMSARGAHAADLFPVDPLLDCGEADAELEGGFAGGEQRLLVRGFHILVPSLRDSRCLGRVLPRTFRPGLYYTAPARLRWLQQVNYAFGKAEAATGAQLWAVMVQSDSRALEGKAHAQHAVVIEGVKAGYSNLFACAHRQAQPTPEMNFANHQVGR